LLDGGVKAAASCCTRLAPERKSCLYSRCVCERESVCVWVCVREYACMYVCVRESLCLRVCVSEYVFMCERECVFVGAWESTHV